ncbi:hypothetical protein E6C27_scaffold90G00570 [Cucumis melo var. makuwa]|uniref:Uncharacterized protein n=1 Tax=Cucumis melo var. makuwa TaxID=1194695 RepID=A0A5A7VJH2_CUCMM|nr:hypothetical protein E6C27_scaffold90G00570 [Cucumis melo var. makuwa]
MFLELELGRKLGSSKELQSLRMFLKLESSKKACIFKGASIFEGVLEVGVLEESFWSLGRKFISSRKLQSLRVFLKLEFSKKACIFKAASIFEGVLDVGVLEESFYLQKSFNLRWSEFRSSRSDRAPSSFGEVILPSAIQLLLGDDRAFAVKSTVLVEAIGHLRHLERWGDIAVSDPTSIGGRSGFCRQIHRPGRSDRTPSSFGEVILPSAIQLLSEDDQAFAVRSTVLVEAIGHHRRLERWRQNCTIDVFLEKQRGGKATSTPMKPKVFKLA